MDIREQTYVDVCHTSPEFKGYGFDLVQVKLDGQWCRVVVRAGAATVTSRNGQVLAQLRAPGTADCTLIGEYMAGTERAKRDRLRGGVYVFDCVEFEGSDLRECTYAFRHDQADRAGLARDGSKLWLLARTCMCYLTPASAWAAVVERDREGLIYRRSGDTYAGAVIGREKRVQTVDLTWTGRFTDKLVPVFADDAGGLHPVKAGLCLAERRQMAAAPAQYKGRTAEFSVLKRLASGKLRNGMFLRWRTDK